MKERSIAEVIFLNRRQQIGSSAQAEALGLGRSKVSAFPLTDGGDSGCTGIGTPWESSSDCFNLLSEVGNKSLVKNEDWKGGFGDLRRKRKCKIAIFMSRRVNYLKFSTIARQR